MKYQLGAFVLFAVSTAASAQSSVTLYGRVDGGVEYLNHIANGTGGSSSRWSAESRRTESTSIRFQTYNYSPTKKTWKRMHKRLTIG